MDQSNTATTAGPEAYVRINVTKNTKGYSYETTVSLRWDTARVGGSPIIAGMLSDADRLARDEIARREREDEAGR